jgi:Ca2+/H+ antiporter, TMEM165/GDT1 family
MSWAHVGTVILAAFLASLVEFVEALTIVLAVGTTRGWRSALIGAGTGALFLTGLTLAAGPALQRFPLTALQLLVGVLLLLFGMRWLRKAILRAGGVIGLHDEAEIYARETAALARDAVGTPPRSARLDRVALATSFKAVTLEGLEVIFIVIATGARGLLAPAAVGAALAGSLVILAGLALRRPLARVPENTLKFAVGVLLSAFGVFWVGEGLRYPWAGEDLALVGLAAGFMVIALLAVAAVRRSVPDELMVQLGARP